MVLSCRPRVNKTLTQLSTVGQQRCTLEDVARRTYQRLEVDERRRQLVARATDLFGEHGYDELSMARIARESGISKPLLYHYFPSKRALFAAALEQAAGELRAVTEPDPDAPPIEQLSASLLAFLDWVGAHRTGYAKLLRSLAVAEVREIVDAVRAGTTQRILDGLGPEHGGDRPAARAAVSGWLWSIDGASLAWIEGELDLTAAELRDVLLGALGGALLAAGASFPAA
jgi:AcrR family transcriptional regulator